jgi:hypothetical protein
MLLLLFVTLAVVAAPVNFDEVRVYRAIKVIYIEPRRISKDGQRKQQQKPNL